MVRLLALLLGALLCLGAGPPPPMAPTEQLATCGRFLAERRLTRAELAGAVRGLDRAIAEVLVDTVLAGYARDCAAVDALVQEMLFTGTGAGLEVKHLSEAEVVEVARRVSEAAERATESAVRELAQGAAGADRPAAAIEADLYRRLAARSYERAFEDSLGDPTDELPFDVLEDLEQACREEPSIGAARAKADDAAKAALAAAIEAYRAEGRALGKAVVERSGPSVATVRSIWGGQPGPPALAKVMALSSGDERRWRAAAERLADAVEAFLVSTGDGRAAATWQIRVLERMGGPGVRTVSWGRTIADAAALLGATSEEQSPMRAVLDAALAERAARLRAVDLAYRRWRDGLVAQGTAEFGAPVSDALRRAFDAQLAFERGLRDQVLAAAASPRLASQLRSIEDPLEAWPPRWLRWAREREESAKQDAVKEETP